MESREILSIFDKGDDGQYGIRVSVKSENDFNILVDGIFSLMMERTEILDALQELLEEFRIKHNIPEDQECISIPVDIETISKNVS